MKGFWKWFFIILGVLVLMGIGFGVTMFFFRGGAAYGVRPGYSMMGRTWTGGAFGGMMAGMVFLMLLRFLLPLGILVLAGFGVAYLVKKSSRPQTVAAAPISSAAAPTQPASPVCSHCGRVLASDWTTCPYCGKTVEPPEVPPAPQA